MEFVLSEGRTEMLRAEIERLSKRAVKLGIDPPKLTVVETDPRPYPRALCDSCERWANHHIVECSEHHGKRYAAFICTIDNPIVALSGYSFSARIDHSEGIVTAMREGYARKYADAKPICQHCNENRQRNTTYVFTDESGGDIQVGSTCLKDFSGAHDAERIAHMLTLYYQLSEYGEDDGWDSGGGGGASRVNTRDYLACVNVAIKLEGWVPKSAHTGTPTAYLADSILYPPRNTVEKFPKPTADDYERADKAIEWARGESESDNDYILTISNLAGMEYYNPRYSGYVASILPAYDRAEGRRVEMELRDRAKAEIVQEIYAPIGERVRDIPVTVTFKRDFDSDYGTSTLINMRTEDNRALSWFASNDPGFEIGESATLTGTVKGFDDKYGSTKVTRCKLT